MMRAWPIIFTRTRTDGITVHQGHPLLEKLRRATLRTIIDADFMNGLDEMYLSQPEEDDNTVKVGGRDINVALLIIIPIVINLGVALIAAVRLHIIILNARIKNVGKYQSCMVSKLRLAGDIDLFP